MRKLSVALCIVFLVTLCGCDPQDVAMYYGRAVLQNLQWGAGGMLQSIITNGDLSGLDEWIGGAIRNAILNGVQ